MPNFYAKRSKIGHLQRAVRRQLIIAGKPLSTTELAELIPSPHRYHAKYVYVAAPKFAERVGYRASRGKPVLWRLK
jgi:hypothetical protein